MQLTTYLLNSCTCKYRQSFINTLCPLSTHEHAAASGRHPTKIASNAFSTPTSKATKPEMQWQSIEFISRFDLYCIPTRIFKVNAFGLEMQNCFLYKKIIFCKHNFCQSSGQIGRLVLDMLTLSYYVSLLINQSRLQLIFWRLFFFGLKTIFSIIRQIRNMTYKLRRKLAPLSNPGHQICVQ